MSSEPCKNVSNEASVRGALTVSVSAGRSGGVDRGGAGGVQTGTMEYEEGEEAEEE